jgi:hypothetical protein
MGGNMLKNQKQATATFKLGLVAMDRPQRGDARQEHPGDATLGRRHQAFGFTGLRACLCVPQIDRSSREL